MPFKTLEAKRIHNKAYYQAHKAYYQAHSEDSRIRHRQWHLKAKRECLTHYGNSRCACVVCGENRLACLSLDHINGGGARERREDKNKVGTRIYAYLRRQGYPKGYQTLCMNCQYVKRCMNGEYGGGWALSQ